MPFTSRTFARITLFLLLVGFAAVFAIVATSVYLAGRNDSSADALIDVLEIRREAFTVVSSIQAAESSQRGYLITLDQPYLEPYRSTVAAIDSEFAGLRELAQSRPEYADDIEALAARVKNKLAELDETIDLAQGGHVEEALAVVRTDRGKVAMDAVNDAASALIRSTDALVAVDTARLRSSAGLLMWVLGGGGIVILGVVGGTAYVAWRYTRDLEMTQAELTSLNATLEARVRERTADVARANEEIQRFAYIVSHDLRAPLVNIMGFTSELETGIAQTRAFLHHAATEEDDPVAEEARDAIEADMPEALQFIRSSTAKMDGLINAILRLSREGRRKLTPERVDMAEILESAGASIRHQLDEMSVEFEVLRPIPAIVTDRLSVEQIFGNLVDNAAKYLDDNRPGKIVVRARETPMGVEYEVEDNGRGIDPKDHERIFDLFRRAGAQDRPGEGIGLSHVRALVRRLGGIIFLRSKLGVGTTFLIRLPRVLSIVEEGEND